MTNEEFAQRVMDELNLDDVDSTKTTLVNLIKQAQAILINAINKKISLDKYMGDALFLGALAALRTQLFYDRTLENNFSLGVQMMLVQLQAKYIDAEEGGDNGNAQDS